MGILKLNNKDGLWKSTNYIYVYLNPLKSISVLFVVVHVICHIQGVQILNTHGNLVMTIRNCLY